MNKPYYITTTLPYVNADPHVGFAMEIIQADVLARHKKAQGFDVFFNTGTDEHGVKIYDKAVEAGKDVKEYVDEYAQIFRELKTLLNIYPDINFIRTTDEKHIEAAQEFWRRCLANDDIYKATQKIKYCNGCELEKTDSELVDDKCPIHPNLTIQVIEEENYFFKFKKYGPQLLELYKNQPDFVMPQFRFNEIIKFVEGGLQDFSVSRLKSKMSWGVPVPNDDAQVMYVWFDALVSYISTLNWPQSEADEKGLFKTFWPGTQVAGKDNLRQQSAIWQAMLMSAKLPQSKQIFIHGFINSAGGQKMSKSFGNVINPYDMVKVYNDIGAFSGADVLRYFLLAEIPTFEDGDMTIERVKETYSTSMANGIGNLTSRILTMADKYAAWPSDEELLGGPKLDWAVALNAGVSEHLNVFEIGKALARIMHECGELDRRIQESEPFKLFKVDETAAKNIVKELVVKLRVIAQALEIFIPETAAEIIKNIDAKQKLEKALFPRVD